MRVSLWRTYNTLKRDYLIYISFNAPLFVRRTCVLSILLCEAIATCCCWRQERSIDKAGSLTFCSYFLNRVHSQRWASPTISSKIFYFKQTKRFMGDKWDNWNSIYMQRSQNKVPADFWCYLQFTKLLKHYTAIQEIILPLATENFYEYIKRST